MYRIVKSFDLWYIYAPNAHRPFAHYSSLCECTDILLSTDNCCRFLVILDEVICTRALK